MFKLGTRSHDILCALMVIIPITALVYAWLDVGFGVFGDCGSCSGFILFPILVFAVMAPIWFIAKVLADSDPGPQL